MSYIGNTPADKFLTLEKQTFTTSATDTYTLDREVSSVNDLELFLNNVRQEPTEAYTISGTTLTLTSAITSSDELYCVYQGRAIGTQAPATNTVTTAMLVDANVTTAKIADSNITTAKINDDAVINAKITDGTIANAKLANSSITLNGSAVSLGGSATIDGGKIGQVVSTHTNAVTFSTTSSSPAAITGLSVAITPSATSSKVLVQASVTCSGAVSNRLFVGLQKNGSAIASGDSSGNRIAGVFTGNEVEGSNSLGSYTISFLDSPNTTSATTYQITGCSEGSNTFKLNRGDNDADSTSVARGASTITVMEVLA